MMDRAAPSPYVSGCEPLVPRVAYGRRLPLCGTRAFLRAPLRVCLQKYDSNLSVRTGHPSVPSALYAEGFPWPLPSVPEGPGQGKPYVRPLRQHSAAPGTYYNARPAFADSPWSQRGPGQHHQSSVSQVLPFGQSMAYIRPCLYAFISVTSFLRKAAPEIKATSSCFALLGALWGFARGLAEARRGGAYVPSAAFPFGKYDNAFFMQGSGTESSFTPLHVALWV